MRSDQHGIEDQIIPPAAGAQRARLQVYGAVCLAILLGIVIDLILQWPFNSQAEIVARIVIACALAAGGVTFLWLTYRTR